MAVALKQNAVINTAASGAVTTTLGSAPTTGNIIIAVVGSNVAAASVSMSTPASGWTTIAQQNSSSNNSISIFARVVAAGEAAGYTASATSATTMFLSVYEISGAAATVAEAVQYSNTNTSGSTGVATLAVGSITPPAGHSGLSVNGIWWQGGTTTLQSIDSSFTILSTGTLRGTSSHLAISSTSGSYNPTYSWTTSRPTVTAGVMVLARPTISKSETVTTSESVSLSVAAGPTASVSDSTILSESVKVQLTSNINKSDTVTTTDTPATPTYSTGFNIALSESVTTTDVDTVVRPAPVLSYTDLTMVAQETGTPYPDNPYIAGEFSPSGTYAIPTAVNDTRSYDVFAGDLGFAWDDGNSGVLIAFGDTFGHNWTGPNVTTAGGAGSPTVAAGSNGVNVNTFTGSGTLYLSSVSAFSTGGGVAAVELSSASNALVYISYTGKSGTTLTGCKTLLSASGTLTTGDRAKANDGWTGAGWRSNVLAYSSDTNLSNGYTISDFKNKTSQNIAQEIISAAHDSEVSTKVFTGSSLTISTIASTYFLVTVTTSSAHGLITGQWVEISGTTNFNGEYIITGTPSTTKFTFTKLIGDLSESTGTAKGAVYANVQNPLTSGYEGSLIPSGGMSVANGGGVGITRQYLFYWSVIYFSPYASQWFTNYASVAYSDDGGATWTKTAAGTTVGASSNGVDVSTFAGSGTLYVASTSSFPSTSGTEIEVVTSNGVAYVTYTGKTATTFTGVNLVRGSGTLSTGNGVRRGIWGNNSTFTDYFQQFWPVNHSDGYVYLMSAQNGRYGSPRMARVAPANVLTKSAYQYWDGSTWNTDYTQATNIFPDTEPVGEPSMYYNTGTQAWISTYYDANANGIVARSAWSPEGPWSTKQTLLSNSAFGSGDMYGGFIHPWSNSGSQSSYDLYFHISLFAPYSTFLMRAQTGVTKINKSETITVTESKTVTTNLQINISETVTTTESYSLVSPTLITVSDASTVSESIFNTSFVTNGDFETGSGTTNANFNVTGWAITNPAAATVVSVDTTTAFSGSQSIKIAVDSGNSNNGIKQSGLITVRPNTTYRFSAWAKSDVAGQIQIQFRESTTGNYLQTDGVTWNSTPSYNNFNTNTSWAQFTFTTGATQTTFFISDFKRSGLSTQANKTFWIDLVQVLASPLVEIPVTVTTSDSTTVSEQLITLITYYLITASDSTTVTESVTVAPDLTIDVSDTTTITTSVSLVRTGTITINVSETIGPPRIIYTTDGELLYFVFKSGDKSFYEKI